jgi:hypothetical protein
MRIMSPLFTVAIVMVSAEAPTAETSVSAVAARSAFFKVILMSSLNLDVR